MPAVVEAQAAVVERRRIIGVKGQRPKVLVVDDIEDNRAVLSKQLSPLGFDVAEARDGAEGLVKAAEFNPKVIIVDLMMPNMAGLELIRHLRREPAGKDKVIIVSSASVFEEDRQKSLAAGGDDFLPKPVKTEQLLEMLRRHLGVEWRYADENGRRDEAGAPSPAIQILAANIPPPQEVAQLYQLAMMGHAAALQEKATELARSDERLAPFAAEVERLAKRLQLNEICEFLERYLER